MRDALDLRTHRPAHFLNVGYDGINGTFADLRVHQDRNRSSGSER